MAVRSQTAQREGETLGGEVGESTALGGGSSFDTPPSSPTRAAAADKERTPSKERYIPPTPPRPAAPSVPPTPPKPAVAIPPTPPRPSLAAALASSPTGSASPAASPPRFSPPAEAAPVGTLLGFGGPIGDFTSVAVPKALAMGLDAPRDRPTLLSPSPFERGSLGDPQGHVSMSMVGLNDVSSPVSQVHRAPPLLDSMREGCLSMCASSPAALRQQQDAYDNLSGSLGARCAESVLGMLDTAKQAPSAPPPPPLSWMGSQGRSSTKSASPSAQPPSAPPPHPPPPPPGLALPTPSPESSVAEDTFTPLQRFAPEHALDGSSAGGTSTTPTVTLDVSGTTAIADAASRVARLSSEGSSIDTDTCTVAKSDIALKSSTASNEPSRVCTDGPIYSLSDIKSHYFPGKADITPAYSLQPAEPPNRRRKTPQS